MGEWVSQGHVIHGKAGVLRGVIHTCHSEKKDNVLGLLIFHGFGEHSKRYDHFPSFLKDTLDVIGCWDHRGHGQSSGQRGHIETFDAWVQDAVLMIQAFQKILSEKSQKPQMHLLGHSLGGLTALRVLLAHPEFRFDSVTISAPLLGLRVPVPTWKKVLAQVLSRYLGFVPMKAQVNAEHLSHDPQVVQAYQTDPWVHGWMTPRFFVEMQAAIQSTRKQVKTYIDQPVQFLIPLDDRIVDAMMSLEYSKKLNCLKKSIKTYPDFFHEPFHEVQSERAFDDLKVWIQSAGN